MNRTYLALALAAGMASTGCATLEGKLDNRLACSVAGDKLFVVSEYGPIGIASAIADADRRRVCGLPLVTPAVVAPAAAASASR